MPRTSGNKTATLAGRAIGKVYGKGRLGTSLVTFDEIEAMVALLILFGVPPLRKDEILTNPKPTPDPEGEPQ